MKVLITGVYGLIANAIYDRLKASPDRYDIYALDRNRTPSARVAAGKTIKVPDERFFQSDLANLDEVRRAATGMDVVVHMAADPNGENGFESVLQSNLIGAYNVFEACRLAGVKRVIFASSIQVVLGYRGVPIDKPIADERVAEVLADLPMITAESPPRPFAVYACSKVWGEALARHYSDAHGLSCICLRIGWVVAEDRPPRPDVSDVWCSQRDVVELTERCINAPDSVRFDIFYAISDNRQRWVDVAHAREVVGFVPQDRAEDRLT